MRSLYLKGDQREVSRGFQPQDLRSQGLGMAWTSLGQAGKSWRGRGKVKGTGQGARGELEKRSAKVKNEGKWENLQKRGNCVGARTLTQCKGTSLYKPDHERARKPTTCASRLNHKQQPITCLGARDCVGPTPLLLMGKWGEIFKFGHKGNGPTPLRSNPKS